MADYKPPLYDFVDRLYHIVMDRMPEAVQERNMASAFTLGAAGTVAAVKGVQWLSAAYDQTFRDKTLPNLEVWSVAALLAAPIIYNALNPGRMTETIIRHPTYTSGMLGSWLGGTTSLFLDYLGSSV